MKEKLFEVKTEIKAKARDIVTAVKQERESYFEQSVGVSWD